MDDKMKGKAPNYVMPEQKYDGQPVGYPDMSGRDPASYGKVLAQGFKPYFCDEPQSHSVNPEKNKFASMSELKQMKLSK